MAPPMSELSRTVLLKQLENGPYTVEIEATEVERDAVAKRLSLDALSNLSGTLMLETMTHPMFDGPVINAEGALTAVLTQICVVTLEPFETTAKSGFSGVFSNDDPASSMVEDDDAGIAGVPDILGPVDDETINIGEVLVEQLALEINPFPRKPGAEFGGFSDDSTESKELASESPFAVLAKLKDNLE